VGSAEVGESLVLFFLLLAVPIVIFNLLRRSFQQLLQETVKVDAGVTFYLRSFFLVLFLSALSAASETLFQGIAVQAFVFLALPGLAKTLERTLCATGAYAGLPV
jgi:hypothetical protein